MCQIDIVIANVVVVVDVDVVVRLETINWKISKSII